MNRFCGLILAGGAGSRFGRPKAFATLPNGTSFLQACHDAHLEAGAIVVAATLPPASTLSTKSDLLQVRLPRPDLDMFDSLKIGLQHLVQSEEWRTAVIHPVDHPLVLPDTIRALAESGYRCAIPSLNGRHGHPITLDRPTAEEIASGRLKGPTLREVLRGAGACDVHVSDPGIRVNCNTPEALLAAWHDRP